MAVMKVRDLIAQLEDMDENAEVRLATQPHYPLEYRADEAVQVEVDGKLVVYLTEGTQLGGLPGAARDELGWR